MLAPARVAAFDILLRIERDKAYAIELLHSQVVDKLSASDRNLTAEIVMGVLRWRSLLDKRISSFRSSPLRQLDLEVITALRMGTYQLLFLTRVPAHAVLNDSVELVKRARKRSAAAMVNAVLRKMVDQTDAQEQSSGTIAEKFAHPEWLVTRWIHQFGLETTTAICQYDQQVPATILRLSSPQDDISLSKDAIQLAPGALMRNARRVIAGNLTSTDLYRSGRVAIQDEGSQLVAALVGNGRRILDCCAAPGGKAAAIAARLPHAEIVASELHPHRARLLRRIVQHPNVRVLTANALQLPFSAEFDRVLADVPCSGTGTLARNPEIKWRITPEDLVDLQARQIGILRAAMKHVVNGGKLVYSTCSLEPEENEHVVSECLSGNVNFRIVPVREELERLRGSGELVWGEIERLASGDFLRTIPGMHPCDGFFAAIFQRG